MKILHISALPVWSMDGKGGMPSLRETLKGHLKAGNEIFVVLPQYDLFSESLQPLPVIRDKSFPIAVAKCRWLPLLKLIRSKIGKASGSNSIPYPFRWLINLTMMTLLTMSLFRAGFKIIKQKRFIPDLLYAHNQYAALAGYILAKRTKIPNVTRLYGTFLADLMKKPFVSLRYPTAAAGYIVPSDMLICGNDGTRGDEVAKKFKISSHKFRFWQNGIDPPATGKKITKEQLLEKSQGLLKPDTHWIVSCSRLAEWKRIDRMLNALALCDLSKINCQLVIAGDGPEKSRLIALASELEVSNYVVWLGAVDHDDIWGLMNAADAFMITNDVTNRCNPLYEASWAGLPVLSVYDPSTSDLLSHEKNALLSQKDDAKHLASNIERLLGEKELADRLSREQKKLSESFWTWEERMKTEVVELGRLAGKH